MRLSGKAYIKFLNEMKQRGYTIHLFFLWINSVTLALERIELRVRNGGHYIPEVIVRRRFDRSLTNFFEFYQPLADSWAIFDNSADTPRMVAFEEEGMIEIIDPDLFGQLTREEGRTMKKAKRSSSLLAYQAEEALRKAVAEAIDEHRRNGVPIAIWRNGRVVRIMLMRLKFENLILSTVSLIGREDKGWLWSYRLITR